MQLEYYLWLQDIKGCGNCKIAKLLNEFGDPRDIYEIKEFDELLQIDGISFGIANAIIYNKSLDKYKKLADDIRDSEIKYITSQDESYPSLLREIDDYPSVLFYKGKNILKEYMPAVAMVGTRNATPYGTYVTCKLASSFARSGVTVVSGLASGIDAHAHRSVLGENGATIAVLGCGVDVVYPYSNKELYNKIIEKGGMIISEYLPGTKPVQFNFPQRNRIISGLSMGTVVVEASKKSGSLITARMAAEQGRDVFAVPGNITQQSFVGCNQLLQDGAKLVTNAQDVLSELLPMYKPEMRKEQTVKINLNDAEKNIIKAINCGYNTVNDISKYLKVPINLVNSNLTMLEIKGAVSVEMGIVYIIF